MIPQPFLRRKKHERRRWAGLVQSFIATGKRSSARPEVQTVKRSARRGLKVQTDPEALFFPQSIQAVQ
jgi:hypothetical protein